MGTRDGLGEKSVIRRLADDFVREGLKERILANLRPSTPEEQIPKRVMTKMRIMSAMGIGESAIVESVLKTWVTLDRLHLL